MLRSLHDRFVSSLHVSLRAPIEHSPISKLDGYNFPAEVPRVVNRNKAGQVVVIELINSDVDARPLRLKPRMGFAAALAGYCLKILVPMLAKVFAEKQDGIATGTKRELPERDWQSFRVAIYYPPTEVESETVQVAWVVFQDDGSIGFTKMRPKPV